VLGEWVKLLGFPGMYVKGLRRIKVAWDSDVQTRKGRGLGDNLGFVRALGRIQGLKRCDDYLGSGYFVERWKGYLEDKMRVEVQARCGYLKELREVRGLSEEEVLKENGKREMNDKEIEAFERFQEGTEG
jgi:hypothetical protein